MSTVTTSQAQKAITEKQFNAALDRFATNSRSSAAIISKSEARIAAEMKKRHESLGAMPKEMEQDEATIKAYCEQNKEKLFTSDRRNIETAHGLVGFRKTPFAVKLGENTEEEVIEALKSRKLEIYISTKESINKKLLTADREDKVLQKQLDKIGVSIEEGENFYIKLN